MILLLVFLMLFLLFLSVVPVRIPSLRTWWYLSKIHGPRGLPLLGLALEVALLKPPEYLDFLKKILKEYPRAVGLWLLGLPVVILEEPEDIEAVLGNMSNITKGAEYESLRPWLQEGLLTSTGDKWHTRRKILTPSFHFQILDDSLQSMNRNAVIFAQKLLENKEKSIDLEHFSKMCTLDVICETVMGVNIRAQVDEENEYTKCIKRICEIILVRDTSFWLHRNWMFHLSPYGFEFRKILKYLHRTADKVMSERKKKFLPSKTQPLINEPNKRVRRAFLDTLLEYESNHPNSFSEYDIREEIDTFLFEGHDTTASALTHTLFLIGAHKDVQERVASELEEIFGDSDRGVDMKDLARMTYLDRVIKESLRIFPSVPYISRTLTTDVALKDGKTVVPAGTNVVVSPFIVHRNQRFFPDPEKFDPERFSESGSRAVHPFAYIPFSAGPRNCIGQKFAVMELKILLSTVLRRARVESLTDVGTVKPMIQLILRPNVPLLVKISPREKPNTRIEE